ncbi:hypothetical protein ACFHW2_11630 [Actinomadura sp. LOL_016]
MFYDIGAWNVETRKYYDPGTGEAVPDYIAEAPPPAPAVEADKVAA